MSHVPCCSEAWQAIQATQAIVMPIIPVVKSKQHNLQLEGLSGNLAQESSSCATLAP